VPLLLLLALTQSTVFTRLHVGGAVPNLVLCAVVVWNLLRGTREGLVWAFVGGLALDLLSAGPLGLSSIALLAVCALAGLAEGRVQPQSLVLSLVAVTLGTMVFDAIVLLGLVLSGHALGQLDVVAGLVLASVLLNVLGMLPLHWLLRRLYLAAERSEVRLSA
jgi:rod shape-determining protein MreD